VTNQPFEFFVRNIGRTCHFAVGARLSNFCHGFSYLLGTFSSKWSLYENSNKLENRGRKVRKNGGRVQRKAIFLSGYLYIFLVSTKRWALFFLEITGIPRHKKNRSKMFSSCKFATLPLPPSLQTFFRYFYNALGKVSSLTRSVFKRVENLVIYLSYFLAFLNAYRVENINS